MNIEQDTGSEQDTGMTVQEAGTAIADLLDDTVDTGEDEAQDPEGDVDDTDEADEADDADEDTDAPDDTDEDGEETDDQADAAPEPELITVKVDGKEMKVTKDDLIRSYQLDTTARQRLEAASAELRGLTALKTRVETAVAAITEGLQAPEFDPAEMEALRTSDPAEYAARRLEMQDRLDQAKALEAEQDRITALEAREAKKAQDAHIARERQALIKAFPDWSDPKKFAAGYNRIGEYAVAQGVSPEEFEGILDSRVIQALEKARRFDAITAKAAKASEQVRSKAKPAITPGTADTRGASEVHATRAEQRLKKTGSIRDAAAAIAARL